jgi:DNA primase
MGSTMSKTQEELLSDFGRVVAMLDGDEAGRMASGGIADLLERVAFQVDLVAMPDGMQPDQLSTYEVHRLVDAIPAMK